VKDVLDDKQTETYKSISGNLITIVLGNFNAKCEWKSQYFPCIGTKCLHSNINNNGQRLIAFATSNGLTISSITFPHKNINKFM
jgi:hypothetical protein